MTMHNAIHPDSNVDRFYIPRKEGGRGLQCVEETVKLTELGLENYVKESRERLIEPIWKTTIEAKKQKKEEIKTYWEEKILYDQFVKQTKEVGNRNRCHGRKMGL